MFIEDAALMTIINIMLVFFEQTLKLIYYDIFLNLFTFAPIILWQQKKRNIFNFKQHPNDLVAPTYIFYIYNYILENLYTREINLYYRYII